MKKFDNMLKLEFEKNTFHVMKLFPIWIRYLKVDISTKFDISGAHLE